MLASCGDAESHGKKPVQALRVAAGDATMTVEVCGLAGSTVAFMLFQDLDNDGQVSHRGRLVRTVKLQAEQAAGRFLMATLGAQIDGGPPVSGPDTFNVANTNALEHAGRARRVDYGEHAVAEEHTVVPKPGKTGELDAWLLGTTFDARRQGTVLNLLDAAPVEDGPVAQAVLLCMLPLGLPRQRHCGVGRAPSAWAATTMTHGQDDLHLP